LEQATDTSFFKPVPLSERVIQFSAYGRREPVFHEAVKDFCAANDFYYDYTMSTSWDKHTQELDLYRQYAWHLNHSVFTFSWPVELTNPLRAGHLYPITCRWFEAAAAGTVMIGKPPGNILFKDLFFAGAVKELDVSEKKNIIFDQLEDMWNKREQYHNYAIEMQEKYSHKWSWNERVQRVLSWLP
jgi:Glycosyl transferases group 1